MVDVDQNILTDVCQKISSTNIDQKSLVDHDQKIFLLISAEK